jgi:hypothetical protein
MVIESTYPARLRRVGAVALAARWVFSGVRALSIGVAAAVMVIAFALQPAPTKEMLAELESDASLTALERTAQQLGTPVNGRGTWTGATENDPARLEGLDGPEDRPIDLLSMVRRPEPDGRYDDSPVETDPFDRPDKI